jgi:hypothetical protein
MSLGDLDQVFQEKQLNLVREWESPHRKRTYAKPSPTYLNMRYISQRMITAKRFEEMGDISRLMRDRMEMESAEAGRRLAEGYARAEAVLFKWLETEQKALRTAFDSRLDHITSEKSRTVNPYEQRFRAIAQRSAELKSLCDIPPKNVQLPPPTFPVCDNMALFQLNATPKLKLPHVPFNGRPLSETSSAQQISLARTAASLRKAPSSVSGMEVTRGSISGSGRLSSASIRKTR